MKLTTISKNIALAIKSSSFSEILEFIEKGNCNEYLPFTHFCFFYSFPEFGIKWHNGKDCEYHRVETACHLCKKEPERNFAGIGTMYLLNNGIGNESILVKKGKESEMVPNTWRLSPMIILCRDHVKGYFLFKEKLHYVQLKLF